MGSHTQGQLGHRAGYSPAPHPHPQRGGAQTTLWGCKALLPARIPLVFSPGPDPHPCAENSLPGLPEQEGTLNQPRAGPRPRGCSESPHKE